MSRFQILAVIACTASALTPLGVCGGGERSDAPPIKIAPRLFNHKDEAKLGLRTVKGEHQVLYRATEDSYKFCHEQNIAVYNDKLYVMWSNGITHESHNGQRILYSHSKDGVQWSKPAVLAEDHDGPGPLACISAGFHAHGDTLVAYYTAIVENRPGIDDKNALFYLTSKDGRTWSRPQKLAQSSFLEGPRRLPNGRLLMNGQWASQQPRLRYTDSADGIAGWKDGKIAEVKDIFSFPEPSWFIRADGTIVMIFRTKSGDPWIYASVSKDNGESWTKPVKTNFPDATARAFAGNLPDGTAFIISNPSRVPSKTHPSIGRRNPLTIALSNDGVLFDRAFVIRSEETSMRFKGINKLDGWQYPSAVVWKDHLYVAYSINKEDEGVTRIDLRDLQAVDHDHRIDVKIDRRVTIVPPGSGLKRAMLGMVRHPDGSIFLNLQTQPVLLTSRDNGKNWGRLPVKLADAPPKQTMHGLGISRDGRLWLMHQSSGGKDLFVSVSKEPPDISGNEAAPLTWMTTRIDYARLAPNRQRPFAFCYNDYNTFFQQPDGTMLLGVGLRYEDWKDYQQQDQSRPGFHETLIRSRDGGRTWGDPAEVHAHVAETCYAIDPNNPKHVLAMTRKQRMLLCDEDAASVTRQAGVPPGTAWPWKGAILLESTDGGHSFREVPGSYLGYYSHRGTMLWTKENVIVAPHTAAGLSDYRLVVNISLDGGKTWVDGTQHGATAMSKARDFVLVPNPPGFSFTTPTVRVSRNHFLTVHCSGTSMAVKGVFWHIEDKRADRRGADDKPLTVRDTRQLFIDDHIIESLDGVAKKLNRPTKHPGNPVLSRVSVGKSTWEAGMPFSFASVLYVERERLFRMWYSLHRGSGGDDESVLCFATSPDGIRWHKPALGMFEYRGTKKNNIVMPHSGLACGVFQDPHETDSSKRYKMVHMWRDYKVYASHSADGLRWTPYNGGQPVFFKPPGHDSHMISYWDNALGKYVAIIRDRTGRISDVRPRLVSDATGRRGWRKLWDPQKNRSPENHSIRRVGQIESTDFVHWNGYQVILGADADDPLNQDQFYNMEVLPYEELRIGLMTVFSYDPNYCRGAVQLTYSRDGRNWHRAANRDVFLPLSQRPGDFDWGGIYPLQAPIVVGDEIWIYYTGYGVDHHHQPPPNVTGFPNGIGLAKLRLDGFVSVDAGATEGTLTTKPFVFDGSKFVINADAKSGQVLVEILNADDKPLAGFSKRDCDPVQVDKIRQTVTWNGKSDLTHVAGKQIKLRFYLKNAKLFSFWFR
jgi:hypothetical protein